MANLTEPQTVPAVAPVSLAPAARRLWQARGVWLGLGAWGVALGGLGALARDETRGAGWGALGLAGVLGVIAWGARPPLPGLPPGATGPVAGGWAGDRARAAARRHRPGRAADPGGRAAFLADPGRAVRAGRANLAGEHGCAGGGAGRVARHAPRPVALPAAGARAKGNCRPPRPPRPPTLISSMPERRKTTAGRPVPLLAPVCAAPARWPARPVRFARLATPSAPRTLGLSAAPPHWPARQLTAVAGLVGLAAARPGLGFAGLPLGHSSRRDPDSGGRRCHLPERAAAPFFRPSGKTPTCPRPGFRVAAPAEAGRDLAGDAAPAGGAVRRGDGRCPFTGCARRVGPGGGARPGPPCCAVSAVRFHYSRVTLNNIVTPFFWAVCFFFLLRGLRTRRPGRLGAGRAGRGAERVQLLRHATPAVRAGRRFAVPARRPLAAGLAHLGHFALLALGYLAAFGPLLAYFLTSAPTLFRARAAGVLLWDHIPRDAADLQAMWNTLWPLMARTCSAFNTIPSMTPSTGRASAAGGEAALLALGTALLIWRWRHPAAFLLLLTAARGAVRGRHADPAPGRPALPGPLDAAFSALYATHRRAGGGLGPAVGRRYRALAHRRATAGRLLAGRGRCASNLPFFVAQYPLARPSFLPGARAEPLGGGTRPGLLGSRRGKTWPPL